MIPTTHACEAMLSYLNHEIHWYQIGAWYKGAIIELYKVTPYHFAVWADEVGVVPDKQWVVEIETLRNLLAHEIARRVCSEN